MANDCLFFLKRVELEINTNCNKKADYKAYCEYCPNSKLPPIKPPRYMDEKVFIKIINELQDLKFSGRISYHFYGEPLLHPDIEKIIKRSAKKLPDAEKVLYTNGDKLDQLKYERLIEAGIDIIAVSNHHKISFPQRPQQKVLENFHLNNKAGLVNIPNSPPLLSPLKKPCFAFHHRLVIAYNADILLCYEDAGRKNVIGNVRDKSIKDVWSSRLAHRIRKDLANCRRDLYEPCKQCNNTAHTKLNQIHVNQFEERVLIGENCCIGKDKKTV
jgi:GTP 3',8-cyclase